MGLWSSGTGEQQCFFFVRLGLQMAPKSNSIQRKHSSSTQAIRAALVGSALGLGIGAAAARRERERERRERESAMAANEIQVIEAWRERLNRLERERPLTQREQDFRNWMDRFQRQREEREQNAQIERGREFDFVIQRKQEEYENRTDKVCNRTCGNPKDPITRDDLEHDEVVYYLAGDRNRLCMPKESWRNLYLSGDSRHPITRERFNVNQLTACTFDVNTAGQKRSRRTHRSRTRRRASRRLKRRSKN